MQGASGVPATLFEGYSMNPIQTTRVLALLIAAGCDSQSTTGPLARPLSGQCALTVSPAPGPAPAPPLVRQTDTGTCDLVPLGRVTFAGILEINPVSGTQVGERTMTTAAGDTLRLTSVGTSTPAGPGLLNFTGTLTFTGGTGIFRSASGEARGEGTANLMTRQTQLSLNGVIVY